MRRFQLFAFLLIFSTIAQAQGLPIFKVYRFHSGNFNQGGAEHHAFDPLSKRLFSSNAAQAQFDILRIGDLSKAGLIASIDLSTYGDRVNSIAVQGNNVAVAVQASFAQSDGKVLFFDTNGTYINQLVVGPKPKMLSFSPSLQHLVVANEGIPSDDYSIDPAGTVSIINFSSGRADNLSQADVQTVSFARYDTLPFDPQVLILGDNGNASFSEDVEPEHLAFNNAGNKVYVSLQDNNALAIIDLQTASLDTVVGLGYKDYNLPGMGLDASDQSTSIKIENHFNLFGLYQPKAISYYSDATGSYILSANEGENRNYSAFTDNERINNVNLNPIVFNSPSTLQNDTVLGRLKINTGIGNYNNPFIYDSLFTFGTRSFSVWSTNGQLIWDSGDEFEQTLSSLASMNFNSSATSNNSFKTSSPEKGAEPKAICTGTYGASNYAFIALEQMGGIMIYNIDNPAAPVFDSYLLDRDFSVAASDSAAGDLGPEFMSYIKASDSPSGLPLLVVSNGVSGTVSIYQIGSGLSLNEEQWEALQAYPNPTSGPLFLSTKSSFRLYNSQGQYLRSFKNCDELDLSHDAKGYYFLKSEDGASIRVLKIKMLKDQILEFYGQLNLDENRLPAKVRVMNPYQNQEAEVDRLLQEFYGKYYPDSSPRGLILGINPGRLGAGQTGIPFTDSPSLRDACGIRTSIETRETSSEFVYKMIEAYGGADSFYQDWFIGAACPLGFLHFNERGNWINWNYYDEEALFLAVKDFMIEQLKRQIELCGNPKSAVVWGTGKNMKYLTKLNKEAQLFKSLIPLEHPRYIMQYKRKRLDEYLQKFLGHLKPEPRD